MKLVEGNAEIEIFPDKQFATDIILKEIKTRGTGSFNPAIEEELCKFPIYSEESLNRDLNSFKFKGAYTYEFKDIEEAKAFKVGIDELVQKINTDEDKLVVENIDNILFIVLLYFGYKNGIKSYMKRAKYLDDLIGVYYDFKINGVKLNLDTLLPDEQKSYYRQNFDDLTDEEKETLIELEVANVEARMISSKSTDENQSVFYNTLVYIPNDFELNVKSSTKRKTVKTDSFILPETLSKRIISEILKEVVEEHEKSNTRFFKELCAGGIKLTDLKERSRPGKQSRENWSLFFLISKLERYLDESQPFNLTKNDKYAFIYDLFSLLGIKNLKPLKNKRKRYELIRDNILKDNDPQKRKVRGKTIYYL